MVRPSVSLSPPLRFDSSLTFVCRYIINDLNTNSAICRPAHDERVSFPTAFPTAYTLEGYAYGGGGRRITHVEISTDVGVSWTLADVTYPEDAYRTRAFKGDVWGTLDITDRDECFCWSFWKLEIPLERLAGSMRSVAVRAIDESLHLQGKSMYWK